MSTQESENVLATALKQLKDEQQERPLSLVKWPLFVKVAA